MMQWLLGCAPMSWLPTREEFVGAPSYPVTLAAAYVLTLWIESGVSFFAVWRSLAVIVLGVGVALVVLGALLRRPHIAAAAVTGSIALLVSRGVVGIAGTAVLLLAVPLALFMWARVRRKPVSAARMTSSLNTLSVFLLAVVLMGGVPRGSYAALLETDLRQGAAELPPTRESADAYGPPSILLLLLDGYPRADALEAKFGHDNTPFIRELEDRGFEVAAASRSNYPYTQATLTSMFHMRPLGEIPALDAVASGNEAPYPRLRQVANDNPVFDELRARGYLIVTSSPGFEHVTMRQGDVFLDNGSLNEPERHLIRGTTLQWLIDAVDPGALADQHRQRILAGLEHADEIAATLDEDGPVFAFLHIPSPHMPVVLDADGGLQPESPTVADFRREPVTTETAEAYVGQLTYLNGRTLATIDRALSAGSGFDEPIIVLMSDHGAAPPTLPGQQWEPAHYANFIAMRTPASIQVELPMEASPVNLFPRLFNAMFDSEHQEWPDEPFPWLDVPEIELTAR